MTTKEKKKRGEKGKEGSGIFLSSHFIFVRIEVEKMMLDGLRLSRRDGVNPELERAHKRRRGRKGGGGKRAAVLNVFLPFSDGSGPSIVWGMEGRGEFSTPSEIAAYREGKRRRKKGEGEDAQTASVLHCIGHAENCYEAKKKRGSWLSALVLL